jgi:GNAT superfamily N-acetyltransferase
LTNFNAISGTGADGNRGVVMEQRIASEADAGKIADLLTQLGYPASEQFVRKKILELNSHPDEELVVTVDDGSVLGFISLHFIPQLALPGHFARISYLCVDESVRSKGVGQKLEQYVELRARERGCDRIELHCHSRRDLAHRFYFRQGYEESPKYLMKLLR